MWDKIVKRPDHMSFWHALSLIVRWKWHRIKAHVSAAWIAISWVFTSEILCRVFHWHKWFTIWEGFEKSYMIGREVNRFVIRTRLRECERCAIAERLMDHAPIKSDWQYPERLFPR